MIKLASCLLAALFFAQSSMAQQPRRAFVLSEQAQGADLQCGINYDALRAAVSSVLRQNGYTIVQGNDPQRMIVYVVATSTFIETICAVNLNLDFRFYSDVRANWGTNYFADVVICQRSHLLLGPAANMASRARERIASSTEMCISEEERRRR